MAKLECELQGNFDDILFDIERSLMVDEEAASDFRFENSRCVVRTYSTGVNITLFQAGEVIKLIAVRTDDSLSGAFTINTFGEDIYLDTIKNAVEKYQNGEAVSREDADINIKEPDVGVDEKELDVSVDEKEPDVSADEKEPDVSVDEKEAQGIVLNSEKYSQYKEEILKSTFEHCSDTRTRLLGNDREERKVPKLICCFIKGMDELKEDSIWKTYDYKLGKVGIVTAAIGWVLFSLFSKGIIGEFNIALVGIYLFVAFCVCVIILGIAFVLPPTQRMLERYEWRDVKNKFRGWTFDHLGINNLKVKDTKINKSTEVVLYDNKLEFFSGGKVITAPYEDLECIFETENCFIIMVKDRDIFCFAKQNLKAGEEELVRTILTPYYKV